MNKKFIIAIVGSRNYKCLEQVEKYINTLTASSVIIISGGAKGVDKTAINAAKRRNIEYEEILPNWKTEGRIAEFRRNLIIVSKANEVIAFWDGISNGTRHTIDIAKRTGIPVHIFSYEKGII